jgi:hypothetical protein
MQTLRVRKSDPAFEFVAQERSTGSHVVTNGLACLLVILLVTAVSAWGQERFGQFEGTAKDSSGAVLPGASVTITNKTTARSLNSKTGSDGSYIVRDIEPGHYQLRFEAQGFSAYEVPDVNLLVGKTLKVDAVLQVGGTQQVVEVTAASPMIDVSNTQIAHNVTAEEFDKLPKTRTFQSLALASPSVNTGDIEGGIQINGASAAENQFVVDGVTTNSLIHGQSRQNVAFEILQEVQVKTGGIDAEYGGALGGVISAITKSGGNSFHGDVHFYFSGNSVSAGPVKRLLLSPVDEKTVSFQQDYKNPDSRYEPGYSLGGYFIKDKLWFFSAASPQWRRTEATTLFSSGTEQSTFSRKQLVQQTFNKISFDPMKRIRTNFSWLWSPIMSTGSIPAPNYFGNMVTSSLKSFEPTRNRGYTMPKNNYRGQVDFTISNTSLLTVSGGRFWDNYKTSGIPDLTSVTYQTPVTAMDASLVGDVPAAMQGPKNFSNGLRLRKTFQDVGTRTYLQADFGQFFRFLGTHDLKVGVGSQKMVNRVNDAYPNGYIYVYWGSSFKSNSTGRTDTGKYGYYEYDSTGTVGSIGANLNSIYIQDQWRIVPRLTLSLGLRTENEKVPSFRRSYQDYAFEFPFSSKMAPRLGATLDVFGNGKMKVYGSWGRYFDWVKYELSRGTFGGDIWTIAYRSLDTPDVFSLSSSNLPGRNLWNDTPGSVRDRRVPSFKGSVDPDIKPMSTDLLNFGTEFQLGAKGVIAARYVHNNLRRTIEDLGALVNGDEVYIYANPGEGMAKQMSVTGLTPPFDTPKPKRTYDALELSFTRRMEGGFFFNASYVLSRLYGNYPGLMSSDEITTPTSGSGGSTMAQEASGSIARSGSSGSRAWDLDEYVWDSKGHLSVLGRLATDRPHVVKFYGSKTLNWGHSKKHQTEIGGFFYGGSGTPLSTFVNTLNQVEVFVNGRGDLGRTPVRTQTDFLLSHTINVTESKKVTFEFNAINLFNQKTATYRFTDLNRGYVYPRQSSAIDLSGVDLSKGYDYMALINGTADAKLPVGALDPRFGMDDLFNPGFSGRLGVRFTF